MSRSVCILAALTRAVDKRKRWLDSEPDLLELHFTLKIDRKTQQVRFVHVSTAAESEVSSVEIAA